MAGQDSEYEKRRLRNIEANNAYLVSLGLDDAVVMLPKSKPQQPQPKIKKKETSQQQQPRRTSRHKKNVAVYLDALSDDYNSDEDDKGKRKRKKAASNASRASARKMQVVSYLEESDEDEDEDDDNQIHLWKQVLPCTEEALASDTGPWNRNEPNEFIMDDDTWKKIEERYRMVKYVF